MAAGRGGIQRGSSQARRQGQDVSAGGTDCGGARLARCFLPAEQCSGSAGGAAGGHRAGDADCVRQHRQPAAGAWGRAPEGNRGAAGDGSDASAAGPADPDREPGARGHRRGRWNRAGAGERGGDGGGQSGPSRPAPAAQPGAGGIRGRPDAAHGHSVRTGSRASDRSREPGAGCARQRILVPGRIPRAARQSPDRGTGCFVAGAAGGRGALHPDAAQSGERRSGFPARERFGGERGCLQAGIQRAPAACLLRSTAGARAPHSGGSIRRPGRDDAHGRLCNVAYVLGGRLPASPGRESRCVLQSGERGILQGAGNSRAAGPRF